MYSQQNRGSGPDYDRFYVNRGQPNPNMGYNPHVGQQVPQVPPHPGMHMTYPGMNVGQQSMPQQQPFYPNQHPQMHQQHPNQSNHPAYPQNNSPFMQPTNYNNAVFVNPRFDVPELLDRVLPLICGTLVHLLESKSGKNQFRTRAYTAAQHQNFDGEDFQFLYKLAVDCVWYQYLVNNSDPGNTYLQVCNRAVEAFIGYIWAKYYSDEQISNEHRANLDKRLEDLMAMTNESEFVSCHQQPNPQNFGNNAYNQFRNRANNNGQFTPQQHMLPNGQPAYPHLPFPQGQQPMPYPHGQQMNPHMQQHPQQLPGYPYPNQMPMYPPNVDPYAMQMQQHMANYNINHNSGVGGLNVSQCALDNRPTGIFVNKPRQNMNSQPMEERPIPQVEKAISFDETIPPAYRKFMQQQQQNQQAQADTTNQQQGVGRPITGNVDVSAYPGVEEGFSTDKAFEMPEPVNKYVRNYQNNFICEANEEEEEPEEEEGEWQEERIAEMFSRNSHIVHTDYTKDNNDADYDLTEDSPDLEALFAEEDVLLGSEGDVVKFYSELDNNHKKKSKYTRRKTLPTTLSECELPREDLTGEDYYLHRLDNRIPFKASEWYPSKSQVILYTWTPWDYDCYLELDKLGNPIQILVKKEYESMKQRDHEIGRWIDENITLGVKPTVDDVKRLEQLEKKLALLPTEVEHLEAKAKEEGKSTNEYPKLDSDVVAGDSIEEIGIKCDIVRGKKDNEGKDVITNKSYRCHAFNLPKTDVKNTNILTNTINDVCRATSALELLELMSHMNSNKYVGQLAHKLNSIMTGVMDHILHVKMGFPNIEAEDGFYADYRNLLEWASANSVRDVLEEEMDTAVKAIFVSKDDIDDKVLNSLTDYKEGVTVRLFISTTYTTLSHSIDNLENRVQCVHELKNKDLNALCEYLFSRGHKTVFHYVRDNSGKLFRISRGSFNKEMHYIEKVCLIDL